MKRYFFLAAIFAFGLQVTYAANWYVGAGLGASNATDSKKNVDDHVTIGSDQFTADTRVDDWDAALSVFGGYQFNSFIASEVEFNSLGDFDLRARETEGWIRGNEHNDVGDLSGSAILSAPLANRFSIYGRVGVALSADNDTCHVTRDWCRSHINYELGPVYGGGADINVYWRSDIRIEADRLNDVGNDHHDFTAGNFMVYKVEYLWRF